GSIRFATANPSGGRPLVETKSWILILPMMIGAALGFGMSAPAWLAIFDYVHGSAREMQPADAHWQWIVPWRALTGLVLSWWSVRWLPLFHLVLAICAAEVLNVRPNSPTGSTIVLALIVVTIPMSIFGLAGNYGPTVIWIYFQIAVVWAFYELFLPRMRFRDWAPPVATFAILLATYFCIPSNCGVPKYNLSQELLYSAPLDPHRLYLSVYPPAESTYRIEKKPASVGQLVRPGSTSMWAGLHFLNGYSPILPAGVAREFDFRIHREINPHEAAYLVWTPPNSTGLLTPLGADRLVVSW